MSRSDLRARISAIEEAYELFLAFAAQGVRDDRDTKHGVELRRQLEGTAASLDDIATVARQALSEAEAESLEDWAVLLAALGRDAEVARAAVRLVLSRPAISSQLIDNLDVFQHLRALLTDLFLLDELLRLGAAAEETSGE